MDYPRRAGQRALREQVRHIMSVVGLPIDDHHLPTLHIVESYESLGSYNRRLNRVVLDSTADEAVLAHEYCHSLQPPNMEVVRPERSGWEAYRWSRSEREAYAVEAFWRLAERDARWWVALEALAGAGLAALEYLALPATERRRAPDLPGRKARLRANAARRKAGLL